MALRLLPFRQYDEHDVVNRYHVDIHTATSALENPDLDDVNANGVLVTIKRGNLNEDPIKFLSSSNSNIPYKEHSSPIGRNEYPYVDGYVAPVDDHNEKVLGVTLNQTLKYDENGEPLQYRAQKRDELQAVLPYKPVPIATRGLFMFTSNAFFTGHTYSVGSSLMGANSDSIHGKFQNWAEVPTFLQNDKIGTILATGSRSSDDAYAGNYYLVKLDCT